MKKDATSSNIILTEKRSYTDLTDLAFQAIRDAIINGRIKPGERIIQCDIANQMGVSQRTVREALAKLVAKGLVVHEPFKGMRVTALPIDQIREIYILRMLLEERAIDLACGKMTENDFLEMEKLLPFTSVGVTEENVFSAQEANKKFHWIVISASGSKILIQFLEQLWELMFTYQLLYHETNAVREARIKNDLEQHRRYLEALRLNNCDEAKKLNSNHILITIERLIEGLEKEG